ncbi:FANCM protein, partial [Oenanthe oenanthe]|nr:FANCM protein [Oenanthe oenanthe]
MRAVYLSSVRSPALGSRHRMVQRHFNPTDIFSQIPEQDSAYAEDSFCVGDEEEEEAPSGCSEEELCVSFALLPEGSSSSSSRGRYLTRLRRRLQQAGGGPAPGHRRKPSRIIVPSDSSEEETAASREKGLAAGQGRGQLPSATPAQHRGRAGAGTAPQHTHGLGLETSQSGLLDLPREHPGSSTPIPAGPGCRSRALQAAAEVCSSLKTQGSSSGSACPAVPNPSSAPAGISRVPGEQSPPSLCILADSREISSGPEVISSLRAVHGLRVQVCSLGSSDYIVSNRLAVDRLLQSELQSPGSRSRLGQRLQRLQGTFQRVCVIVETDRVRPGDTSRCVQRTQYYDGVLSALVQAGIKILFSSCQQESAALLKELALLEHREDAAIQVPTEPEGHGRELLSFYLSIPNLSYGAALNLCHSFSSITAVANSRPQAEELRRFLRHHFDLQLLPEAAPAKGKS